MSWRVRQDDGIRFCYYSHGIYNVLEGCLRCHADLQLRVEKALSEAKRVKQALASEIAERAAMWEMPE